MCNPICSSWMVDSQCKEHQEEQPPDPFEDYKFELVSKHKDPMTRQIEEAVRINQTFFTRTITSNSEDVKPVFPLNRKGEHFCPRSRSDIFM